MSEPNEPIDVVLFDMSGTLIDDEFIRHGLVAMSRGMHDRWGLDVNAIRARFSPAMNDVSAEYVDRPFYLLREVMNTAVQRIVVELDGEVESGHVPEVVEMFWEAARAAADLADGAIETLAALRAEGIRTGVVSYCDTDDFLSIMELTGLAEATDVRLCSEQARSCKPHPAIFLRALELIEGSPATTLYVGDSVESDIIGANGVGIRTALLPQGEFTLLDALELNPLAKPDHVLTGLRDIPSLVRD